MDITSLSGDRQILNSVEFAETLTPFPEPVDLVYADLIPPPKASNNRLSSPPHKLRPIRCSARSPAAEGNRIEAGSFVEGWEANSAESESRFFSDLNLSSDSANSEEEESRKQKRKRKSRSLGHFLEKMVKKVIEKQERMHSELIETVEKIEKERIRREEVWREIESERLKKEEALRAKETSRSLELVSFLKNLTGEDIQVPSDENWVETEAEAQTYGLGNRRWPESEVQELITLRATLEHKFSGIGSKRLIWDEISAGMASKGFARSAKKCKEKWENMNKYFRRLTENGKKRSSEKTCPYFHELDMLYKSGVMNSGLGDEAKSGRDSESPGTG